MGLPKTKLVFFVFGSLIVLPSIVGGSLFLRTYLKVRTLPTLQDPVKFTREFNPAGKETTKLEISGWEGRIIRSSLFPYTTLKTTQIIQGTCEGRYQDGKEINLSQEGRYLNIDSFWKVSWVEVAMCGEHTKFFGPYKMAIGSK